jgi:hypothetical protein
MNLLLPLDATIRMWAPLFTFACLTKTIAVKL